MLVGRRHVRFFVISVVAAVVLVACSDGGGDGAKVLTPSTIGRAGSEVVEDAPDVRIGAPLTAYAIEYRVEELSGDEVLVSAASVAVARPFRSRLERLVDGEVTSSRVADFAYLGQLGDDGQPEVFTATPTPAPGDVRSDLVLTDDGDEVRTVLGRRCQVHHLGGPALGGVIVPLDEGDGVSTDTCVDADGLILEEVAFDEKEAVTSRWIATKVDVAPSVDDDDFRFPGVEPVDPNEGGGLLRAADPATASQGRFWELPSPPEGFTRMGRYAIVPPQTARVDDPESRSMVIAGVSDVFVRGGDLLVVEQGGTLGQVPPFGLTPYSELIDLGELARNAEVFLTPTGSEIHVLIPPGRYVKVFGSLTREELVSVAEALRPIEGQGLVYL